jgi:phage terminase small subunit
LTAKEQALAEIERVKGKRAAPKRGVPYGPRGKLTRGRKKLGRPTNGFMKPSHAKAVDYYMKGHTKKEALLKAGYTLLTAEKAAWKVFGRDDVRKEIARRQRLLAARQINVVDRIQDEFAKIAFFNMGDVVEVTDDGYLVFNFEDVDMDQMAAVGEITVETYYEGKGKNAVEVKRVKMKPHDKKAALDSLARIHGLFQDRLDLTSEGESLEQRLQRGRQRAAMVEADYEEVE